MSLNSLNCLKKTKTAILEKIWMGFTLSLVITS